MWLQAARFLEEGNHQRKVQLFFTIILTLLEHQLLVVKQKCTPSALAADPNIDVEAMFRRVTNAVKVQDAHSVSHFAPTFAVMGTLANYAECTGQHTLCFCHSNTCSQHCQLNHACESVNLHYKAATKSYTKCL